MARPKPDGERDHFQVRLEPGLKDRLDAYAKAKALSRNEAINRLLNDSVTDWESNPNEC